MLKRIVSIFFLLLIPSKVFSHVRWFVEAEKIHPVGFEWSPLLALILVGACLYVAAMYMIHSKPLLSVRGKFWQNWPQLGQWRLLAFLTGLTFILTSFHDDILAPNSHVVIFPDATLSFQTVLGMMLMSGVLFNFVGGLLLLYISLCSIFLSLESWCDYGLEFFGIGLFLMFYQKKDLALLCLRAGIGGQLIILGIHNKLLNPQLGLTFLEQHSWNFMQMLGLKQFTDLAFVFSAGVAEICFGLVIMLGFATRFAVFTVSCFFVLTTVLLGIHELVGHLPVFAIAIILISLGGGKYVVPALNTKYIEKVTVFLSLLNRYKIKAIKQISTYNVKAKLPENTEWKKPIENLLSHNPPFMQLVSSNIREDQQLSTDEKEELLYLREENKQLKKLLSNNPPGYPVRKGYVIR